MGARSRAAGVTAAVACFWLLLSAVGTEAAAEMAYRLDVDAHIEVVFDGRPMVLDGRHTCRRSDLYGSDGRPLVPLAGPSGTCGPDWYAVRLDDGGALIVGAPVQLESGACEKLPSVIWLDVADAPTAGLIFYATAALDEPESRLSELKCTVEVTRSSRLGALFATQPEGAALGLDAANVLPWVTQEPALGLYAYYAVRLPREVWSRDELLIDFAEHAPYGASILLQSDKVEYEDIRSLGRRQINHILDLSPNMFTSQPQVSSRSTGGPDDGSYVITPLFPDVSSIMVPVENVIPGVLSLVVEEEGPDGMPFKIELEELVLEDNRLLWNGPSSITSLNTEHINYFFFNRSYVPIQ